MEGLRKRIIDFSHRKSLDEPTVYLDEEEQEVLIRELEKTNRRDNRLFQIVFHSSIFL
ncbi:hypothetical protein SJAG_06268 [Schizosaccharomyces japonicus yFS275]|uniref:Uncharacterized protein n=1 Tax=Schizosaccharomyces japonicus (strain yFS275 / FY16936) TaxID=402676 RepID=T0S343_SCHJY|nr:hypothetical protein SJAG_06268 [Schizosaccharomyces japonicus yFS275]EQC53041.1 hypothetical protein SJAG_06268 [Schizosaccharomyces japonicus yFS275]